MPMYSFTHIITDEPMELMCTYEEAKLIEATGEYIMDLCTPMIVGGVGHVIGKVDNGFNDILMEIKAKHSGSIVNTK